MAIKKSRSGESVYTASCAGCHSIGVASAPKTNNKADWAPRLKRGMDDLVKVAISGKGAMPPKGTCGTCSADELRAAIEHMTK
ncbi:MAG TPA: cytochrome c5 family protein [Candidatus Thioglobus sp.]|nr:cytochrome c5 family protein [Candidatus Thioglobus sp.]